MATLKLHQPINMNTLQAWDGDFTVVASDRISVTDGFRTQDYFGNFQFANDEVSGGTLTSTVAYQNGLYYELTDLNADAATVAEYIGGFDFTGALNEVLKGDDTIIGSAGNDVIKGGAGNDTITGGAGVDTVQYGNKSGLIVTHTADANGPAFAVTVDGKIDVVSGVERLAFNDGSTLALDVGVGENAGSAYRLYQAAFDRTPDKAGLNYWTNDLDKGASIQQVAKGFVDSAEFKTLNPSNDQNSIINNYYLHVLHRDADAAGFKYWQDALANGMTPSEMLVSFSESQENINNTAAVLDNGVWLV
jgi:Ca2+-binding RTX toxin-like protein